MNSVYLQLTQTELNYGNVAFPHGLDPTCDFLLEFYNCFLLVRTRAHSDQEAQPQFSQNNLLVLLSQYFNDSVNFTYGL